MFFSFGDLQLSCVCVCCNVLYYTGFKRNSNNKNNKNKSKSKNKNNSNSNNNNNNNNNNNHSSNNNNNNNNNKTTPLESLFGLEKQLVRPECPRGTIDLYSAENGQEPKNCRELHWMIHLNLICIKICGLAQVFAYLSIFRLRILFSDCYCSCIWKHLWVLPVR